MSQPAHLTLSRYGRPYRRVVMDLPGPVFVQAESALDKPGTTGFALAVSFVWLVGVVSLVLLLASLNFGHQVVTGWADWDRPESWLRHSRQQQWPWGTASSSTP